tara:strand:+ start:3291 stop:3539 length:249 start_codon:yes stop_codon:yes gene_type:complete
MKREKRKVKVVNGAYQLLKPEEDCGWHKIGVRKSLKGLYGVIKSEVYDLEISQAILEDVKNYREQREERSRPYKEKGLEAVV